MSFVYKRQDKPGGVSVAIPTLQQTTLIGSPPPSHNPISQSPDALDLDDDFIALLHGADATGGTG